MVGKNVKLSEDGFSALAEINGQVLLLGGKINVEPIYTIPGDVNLRTGNILFLGTVIVKGNVEDGFSVKAAGNIEVFGSVGKCLVDAEGDIVVHQGIAAKTEGKIRCGKSLYSKFIEHAHVDAGEYVVVTDGIVHSHVDANKMILCQGKRAQIVGGQAARLGGDQLEDPRLRGRNGDAPRGGVRPAEQGTPGRPGGGEADRGEVTRGGGPQHQDPGEPAEGPEEAPAREGAVPHRAEREALGAPAASSRRGSARSARSTRTSPR